MLSSAEVPAAAAGTRRLGDRAVNRLGFDTMRLTGTLPFHAGEPRDRDTSVAVLRCAIELGVDHVDTAASHWLPVANLRVAPGLDVARKSGAGPAQVRLAQLLSSGEHVLAIPGTGSIAHVEENQAAASLRLTDDRRARLAAA